MRRTRIAMLAAATALVAMTSVPAAADPEVATIDCSGWLATGALSTPGSRSEIGGHITCTLGLLTTVPLGYEPYRTFSSGLTAHIRNSPVAGATTGVSMYGTNGTARFSDGPRNYVWSFTTTSVADVAVLADQQNNYVAWGPSSWPPNLPYQVRAGYVAAGTRCPDCPLLCDVGCLGFRFVGEFVFDV